MTEFKCDGRGARTANLQENFLQKSFSRFNSAAPQNPPTEYARCSSIGRARIMRADKFTDSKFLLDL